jgi:hypothetical protein
MGSEKQTTETSQQGQQTQQYTPSANELRAQELALERQEGIQGATMDIDQEMAGVIKGLLSGGQGNLSDVYKKLFTGIDENMTQQLTSEALADISPQFQKSGILDSGVAASIAGRTAGDIRRNVAENNLTRVFNLLQTGLGFGGQQQQASSQSLAGLAGLVKGTGTTTGNFSQSGMSTVTSMNPFLKSFQTSLGTALGTGVAGGAGGFMTGGIKGFGSGWNTALTPAA